MKGWLVMKEGRFSIQKSCFFFRLRWGFLTQHITENSAALCKYLIHEAKINIVRSQLKIIVELGPLAKSYICDLRGVMISTITLFAKDYATFYEWSDCLFRATKRCVQNWYSMGRILGQGSEGTVFVGIQNDKPATKVAIKQIPLANPETNEKIGYRLQKTFREVQLQHKAARNSENVAGIIDVFYDNTACFIIMELGNYGALSDILERRKTALPEEQVRNIALQLGRCLLSLHQSNVVHRDVKCDNVLLCKQADNTMKVILSDFGFAAVWRPDRGENPRTFCREFVGTRWYLAPEILQREGYGTPCDIFALGVLCYVSLTGSFPFSEDSIPSNSDKNDIFPLRGISEEAESFCRSLLVIDPRRRLNAAGLLQHSWIRKNQKIVVNGRRELRNCSTKTIFRRVFYALVAIREMRKSANVVHFNPKLRRIYNKTHRQM